VHKAASTRSPLISYNPVCGRLPYNFKRPVVPVVTVSTSFLDESHSREVDPSNRCPLGVEMDTSQQATVTSRDKDALVGAQRRSITEKRRMVEATLAPGPSVAHVARAHGVNANQLFGWLRLYLNSATPVIESTPVLL
jgi:hypothetical protein